MAQQLRVVVTAEHIKKGKKGDEFACPIALAAKAAGVKGPIADVLYDNFNMARLQGRVDDIEVILYSGKRAATFIRRFDNDKLVSPTVLVFRA
jgi:hypothetical protein